MDQLSDPTILATTPDTNTPPQPPTPPPPSKPSLTLPILLTFLLTSTLLIGGFFAYQYFNQSKPVAVIPSPTPTPSPKTEPTSLITSDWKTYTNHVREYSISYPKDWFADTSLAETTLEDPQGAALAISRDNYKITLNWPSNYSPNECVFDDQNKVLEPQQVRCSGDFVSFGNLMRRLINPTSNPGSNLNTWIIYSLEKPDSYVSVPPIKYSSPSKYDPKIIAEMDQILSTFKFNPNSVTTLQGFIRQVNKINDQYQLIIDQAEWIADSSAPNGYRINNPIKDSVRMAITPNTVITMQTFSHGQDGNFNFNQQITPEQFYENINGLTQQELFFTLELNPEKTTINKITEIYRP